MAKRELTEKQRNFLDLLFTKAKGDPSKAAGMAGYAPTTKLSDIVEPLTEEIVEGTRKYITLHGPQAAISLVGILNDPTQLGSKEVLNAAKDILDRGGIKAPEKLEVSSGSPLFILPEKKEDDAETE